MPVKPTMRQTRPIHDRVDADRINAMTTEQSAGGVQNPLPRLGFAVGRISHGVPFGGGPANPAAPGRQGGSEHHNAAAFNERSRKELTAEDVRYTQKGNTVFAFAMGWPSGSANFPQLVEKVRNVSLLGHAGQVKWSQSESGLKVEMPAEKPADHDHAIVCKVTLA